MATLKLENCEAPEQVERWAAQEAKPLHAEMVDIDKQIVKLGKQKAALRDLILAIEKEGADRRGELAGPASGPDQTLGV
ncbi:MAG: hypothetical protein M3440_12705 [Chloroflexota bacterium]|nr:hypothetical protein [Chloroflexota bacterium]